MASSPRERARSDDRGVTHGGVTFASESGARRPPSGGPRSRATTMAGGGPPPSHDASAHAGSRRLSMPQQRQTSVLLSPSGAGARPRATSAAANRGLGTFDERRHDDGGNEDDDDDEEDDRVHNLTFDGVKEGPYMLCKRSDDLLGHRARQVFREKAASMRGENSIFYYLKDLMKKCGSDKVQKKGLTSLQIVLQPHEFRKLVASDAAFQAAIPEEHIDALFYRMVCEDQRVVRHLDFVEFCLFDHHQLRLLLFKFRKRLKKMRLTDNEITDTFRRLSSTGASSISSTLLHAAIARELDVVLTTGEIQYLLQLMDLDCDGAVKVNDFESFVKDDRASFDLIHPSTEHGIVELKITMSEVDELSQRREGFKQLLPAFHEVSNVKVHLWYKSAPREDGKTAITNIRYAPTSRDSELVAKGFTCLQQDVNRSGAFGKHKYIWVSYVPANVQNASEVIDMCLSSGDEDDAKDAKLWLPMHRGFKLVPGDLNERSSKQGVFLWIRRRPMNSAEDLVDTTNEVTIPESPRTQSKKRMHVDELEGYVRQMLRRNCPVEQDGSINFARLFDEFDVKKARSIGKQAMLAGVESFGIKMKPKDFSLIWDRLNPCAKKAIDVTTFASFLEMTDSDIDDVVNTLQRSMTVHSTQQQQMPNYRLIFQSYNSLGDGRLSRADFQRLLSSNQINFTNTEMSKVIQRLDANKDGIVDYSDFLRYVTGVCDAAARRAQRVAAAADNLKAWAMEKQNKKLAMDGQIDSSASWKLLRPKRGILDISSIDHVLRERGIRLETNHLRLFRVLMSPSTNGEINQAAYHAFVNHQPRKLSSMIYDVKKVAGSIPEDGEPDGVYDRLNIEGNGRLSLVTFAKEVNVLSAEKNTGAGPFDLKDFVYIVQWTGADCGGDGAVLIDRFLAAVRDNNERRNMKHEFVTNYDSPTFIEGVKLLREEMRRCAKTPDGKFDYRVPFRLFDKDKSGQIVLSEFEAAVRELGVDKYLLDREVKSLMRRFDLNLSGGIGFEEFLRFNLAESSIKTGAQLAEVEPILNAIIIHERLTPATVSGFCSSLKRMFSIIDKDTHGVVPATEFVRTLRELGIIMGNEEMETLADVFAGDGGDISYTQFCDSLQHVCERSQSEVDPTSLAHEPVEVVDLLCAVYREYNGVRRVHAEMGKPAFDLPKAFGFSAGEKQRTLHLTTDELKEILWACGVHHPFLREELESIQRCFRSLDGGFNGSAFCNFMEHGPAVLFRGADDENGNVGVLDGYISRLQEAIQTYMATGGKDAEERLFRLFDEFDEDGSGSISNEEFVHVLHKAGLRRFLRQEDEELLLQFLDTNGDSVISYREFVDFAKHGERRLNTVANQFEHDGDERHGGTRPPSLYSRSPGHSPPRSPRPPSPSGTVRMASPGRAQSGSPRALPSLILSIARLNAKLRPSFPFDKYVYKYRISTAPSGQALVKGRVFEKIIDKFLARLIENSVAYNMHELDADSLTRAYETPTARPDGAPVVNCDAFLTDLKVAHARATAQNRLSGHRDSDSSDDCNGELSCSSDEGESKSKRAAKISGVLNESIRRDFKSKSDQEALRTKVKAIMSDLEKGKKESKASDSRVFKMFAGLGLRLKKKEAETLLGYLNVGQNGGNSAAYDLKKLASAINEQLGVLVGDTKKQETSSSSQAAPAAAKKETLRISDALVDKMYRCFIAAAQQNISGRKLLERCDTQKTGIVTMLELQTVLRLMGCVLSESELSDVKTAFSGKTAGSIDYRLLVRQLTSQMKPPTLNAPAAPQLQDHRPTPIQTAPIPPPPKSLDDHHPQKPVLPAAQATLPPPRPLTLEESKRLDALVRPYFQDLLKTRRMDTKSLLQAFEPYDLKGSGFAAPDAVHSVLRKYDVWLTDDMARNVLQRYTSPSSGKFDYVEFSTSLGSSTHDSTRETSSKSDDLRSARSFHPQNDAPEPVPAKAPKLPELDSIKLHPQPVSDRHRASSTSLGWSCPVCLHTQTRAMSTSCEICAAQNPASVQYETLLKCSACEFRNRAGSTHCDLCRLPLSVVDDFADAVPSSPQKSKSNKPANLTLQIASTSPPATATAASGGGYDEGWLA